MNNWVAMKDQPAHALSLKGRVRWPLEKTQQYESRRIAKVTESHVEQIKKRSEKE